MNLKEMRAAALKAAKDIVAQVKSENRDLTDAEQKTLDEKVTEVKALDTQLAAAAKSANLLGQLDAMAAGVEAGEHAGRRLGLTGKAATAMAGKAARAMMPDSFGAKALAPSGATVIGQEFAADPIALGQPATGLLDVLPVVTHNAPEFAYLRQSTRTNNAAVVADGALKPTSVYSVTRVEDVLDVVAHLTEAIPQYWLSDNGSLQTFLANELSYGLRLAVEAVAVAAIGATSGVQAQAYATDLLTTTRTAITKVETLGFVPSAFVIRPEDWQTIELSRADTSGVFDMSSAPVDRAAQRLWGVPVAISTAPAAGVAYLLSQDSIALDTDTLGVKIEWSSAVADDFARNQVRARVEGRYAAGVRRPLGVVTIDTAP